MKRLKKRLLIFISVLISLIILLLIISYTLSPQPVNAMMVSFSSFKDFNNKIYIEPSIPQKTMEDLLIKYEMSKNKVKDYFEEIRATPTIIFVQTQESLDHYAQNQTGQTYYTYWGNYIVLGPNGFNENVIAHELMHSELRVRLKNKSKVPVWFDEGLATLVDDRYVTYTSQKIESEMLISIKNRKEFNDPLKSRENYLIAKNEVSRWYELNGEIGLHKLIQGLNEGESFEVLYEEIENLNESSSKKN